MVFFRGVFRCPAVTPRPSLLPTYATLNRLSPPVTRLPACCAAQLKFLTTLKAQLAHWQLLLTRLAQTTKVVWTSPTGTHFSWAHASYGHARLSLHYFPASIVSS